MGGLGNGRRVGRAPPLMIAALVACILVLGFNYWMSSSRNLELQTKLYELEGQVRRAAVERGAAELKKNEFEDELLKQKQQMNHIENVYQKKLEEAQDTCSQVKVTMQQNISSSTLTIQELKGQLNGLNDNLEKLQNELLVCQGNIETLNNKLAYEMTHCQSQLQSEKELCDERVAAAKLEVQRNMEKLIVPPVAPQENTDTGGKNDNEPAKPLADRGNATSAVMEQKENGIAELLSNDINMDKAVNVSKDAVLSKSLPKADSQPVTTKAVKQEVLPPPEGAAEPEEGQAEGGNQEDNNLTEDRGLEVMDAREDDGDTEEDDPGMEGMLIQGKADETHIDQKIEDPEDYDGDEPVVGGVDLEKPQEQTKTAVKTDKEIDEDMANYNGDEENEGEFEADKQAELSHV